MTKTKTSDKAIKAGFLAISADKLGNDAEMEQAGKTCGALAKKAGMSMDDLYNALSPKVYEEGACAWCHIVDGYYDA